AHAARRHRGHAHRRDRGRVRVRGLAQQDGASGGRCVLHRRGLQPRPHGRRVRESAMAEAAGRLSRRGGAATDLRLRRRAGAALGGARWPARSVAGRVRARVPHRPGDRRSDGARHTPPPPATLHVDSLSWTVQLAASGTFEKALALADRLSDARRPAFIAPIALAGRARGTVWYRVLVGAYQSRDSAAAGRTALWRRGGVPHGQGKLLRAPYSLALAGPALPDSLRAHGIAPVRWRTGGLLVGA